MAALIIFIIVIIIGIIAYIKHRGFHDFVQRILTPGEGKSSLKRIEMLTQVLESEKAKTADLQTKAAEVEKIRKQAKDLETEIMAERKSQMAATQKINGK